MFYLGVVYIIQFDNTGDTMESNVIVTVYQNQDDEATQIIYEGAGMLKHEDNWHILEYNNKEETNKLSINTTECKLIRKGTHNTELTLSFINESNIIIETEYGVLNIDVEIISIIVDDRVMSIEYDIIEGKKVVSSFTITWLIKEVLS